MKRLLDVTVAALAIILLLPLLIATALLVKSSLGSPIFFRQERPGLRCRPFYMIKFRTMVDDVDELGQPLPDHLRLTRLGRFLRATSLDELPELWNVLKGDMSLVGPRPLLMDYIPLYSDAQRRRHEVRPGITGWAQVNGRNTISWGRRFELDVWYVDNQSIWLDIKIICLTLKKVFNREGISEPGQATMTPFTGAEDTGE